ncbi:ABATE domain-containing protein [Saccharopolyspora shandongensis]|uniref:ABATE domain-containing protein n=1 Tax=Saccharopolyspora shandongensis TaxID=418495 RepID=UPI003F4CFCF8
MIDPSAQAELIIAFANTVDIEDETDALADTAGLARWLADAGLTTSTPVVTAEGHDRCHRFRSGVRELLGTGRGLRLGLLGQLEEPQPALVLDAGLRQP